MKNVRGKKVNETLWELYLAYRFIKPAKKGKVKCLKKDKRKELCQCMFAAECNLIYHFYV